FSTSFRTWRPMSRAGKQGLRTSARSPHSWRSTPPDRKRAPAELASHREWRLRSVRVALHVNDDLGARWRRPVPAGHERHDRRARVAGRVEAARNTAEDG